MEVVALRVDGTQFPIELAIRRVATDGPPTFLAYVSDLSARKRTETARAFLAGASEALAGSLDYEVTLETVVRLAVPQVADWCTVEMVAEEPREPPRVWIAHDDPEKVALAQELRRRYPPDPDAQQGIAHVLRTGRAELYAEISDALLERGSKDAEHLRILRELRLRSVMIVPLATRGRTLGAILFVAAGSSRRYDPADLTTAEELARRAAMAIENARLYREAQAAEERNRFLAEATEALGSSLDYATTLERVVRLAVPTVADSAAIYRLEDDGTIVLVALAAGDTASEGLMRELDALLPLRIEEDRLLTRVVRTGRTEMLAELPSPMRETWSPTSRASELVHELAIRSYMVVPLVVRGRVFGALALTTSRSGRRFAANDLNLEAAASMALALLVHCRRHGPA